MAIGLHFMAIFIARRRKIRDVDRLTHFLLQCLREKSGNDKTGARLTAEMIGHCAYGLQYTRCICLDFYRVAQKIGTILLYALTLPNINRFSK